MKRNGTSCTISVFAYKERPNNKTYNPINRSWLDRYWINKTITQNMSVPLNPTLIYQSLEEAYKICKKFSEKDIKRVIIR